MAVPVLGLIRCNCDRCDCAASASLSSHDCKPVQCFSVQCLGAVCVAGRAQPQHEPHDGAAALTVHQYASLTTHQPKLALLVSLQAASKGPPRNSARRYSRRLATSGPDLDAYARPKPNACRRGRASHWVLNGRKGSAFEIYATSQERPQAFQPYLLPAPPGLQEDSKPQAGVCMVRPATLPRGRTDRAPV